VGTDYVKITEKAFALSACASGTVSPGINDTLHGLQDGGKVERY